MMNCYKKLLVVAMLATHADSFTRSESPEELRERERQYQLEREQAQRSTTMWAGIIGAAVGGLIGYWIGSEDGQDYYEDSSYLHDFDYAYELLSPREREIKYKLDALSKYGQVFSINDYSATIFSPIREQEILMNLQKLGFRLDQINETFYTQLASDNKILSDAGYSIWWHSLHRLQAQKDLYLTNSNKIIGYFNRHKDFIQGCQLVNFYDKLPLNAYDIPGWARAQYSYDYQYPLTTFKNKVEADRRVFVQLQQRYVGRYVSERFGATLRLLDHVLYIVYNSYAYQQEVELQRQAELRAEYQRMEQERLNIARKQAQALEEANRLAAERNRLERERRDW